MMSHLRRWSIGVVALVFSCTAYAYLTLPDVRPLATVNPSSTAFTDLRAREATAAGKAPKHSQRWIGYRRISPALTRAVLVAEDAAFWQHEGVDYDELQKSIETDWARGQLMRGASTITQQLAKNLFLSGERSYIRKGQEALITLMLEAVLDKRRILELYLNVVEWGVGVFGAEAASRHYYGTSAAALGPEQAARLAAMLPRPQFYDRNRGSAYLAGYAERIQGRMGDAQLP